MPYFLLGVNVILVALVLLGFTQKQSKLELTELIVKGKEGSVEISIVDGLPQILGLDGTGQKKFQLAGSKISLFGENDQVAAQITTSQDGAGKMRLADNRQQSRVLLLAGDTTGVFLKNPQNKTVGSWSMLPDGGTGLGLGDSEGRAASVLRGGKTPSVSFFNEESEPMAALGMIQQVPHLLISGPVGNEGILVHGGKPSSMVVVDELGKVKILISKHGVFQGKEKNQPQAKKREKVFSLEDGKSLFPEQQGEKL